MGPDSAVTHIKGFESAHSVEKVANFNQNQYQMRNMQFRNIVIIKLVKWPIPEKREVVQSLEKGSYLITL